MGKCSFKNAKKFMLIRFLMNGLNIGLLLDDAYFSSRLL